MPSLALLRAVAMALLLLLLLLARSMEGVDGAGGGGNATCPLDLSYVPTFPWDSKLCAGGALNMTGCCMTLLSVLAIGLAGQVRATGHFRIPSVGESAACLKDFGAKLSAPPVSLPGASLVPACFPSPQQFVASPSFCAGVTTAAEYRAVVGNDSVSALDSACGDLSSMPLCSRCLDAGIAATSRLTAAANISANATTDDAATRNCFYLTVTYAAGISNIAGPTYPPTAACTLGLALSTPPAAPSKSHDTVIYTTAIPVAFLLLASLLAFFVWRRHDKKKKVHEISKEGSAERRSHPRPNTGSILYDIVELSKATDAFADRNLVGRGGFGAVYRGELADGSVVAVKKMLDPDVEGGDEEFTNEVEIISHLRHRNLVPLRGCCIVDDDVEEGKQKFLVYDFMPNGALEDFIFRDGEGGGGKRPALTWAQRRSIIMDVAKGLEYLHYGVKPAIYHRDIKATNILLDGEMRARVADFGLARRSREGQSHLTTRVAGTHGYLAPEYALYGQLTEKSDVYSFGVLVLEILSARRVLDMSAPAGPVLITDWAWTHVKAGQAREVLDEALSTAESPRGGAMERFVLVGILCAHVMVALRPTITEAVKMLEGDMDIPELPDRPLPYGHSVMFSEAGSNFSASPAFSGPFIDNGDMLR